MTYVFRVLSVTFLFFPLVVICGASAAGDPSDLPVVAANDNRVPAGVLKGGELTLQLELRRARWYPDRDTDPFIDLNAFSEPGKEPQISGPLIRIPEGTVITANIRNLLPRTVVVHGLHEHPGNPADTVEVAGGATREIRFKAGSSGTYIYWATTSGTSFSGASLKKRSPDDAQLSGAFVVDPPGAKVSDRIFVLGLWLPDPTALAKNVPSVNGKSWPYTEHLSMRVGETASWRVINGGGDQHAMHLHGFHFQVDSLGDGETDLVNPPGARPLAVTQQIAAGATMAITWTPQREGNWLFHCHMTIHMTPHMEIPGSPPRTDHHEHDPAAAGMGGLVLSVRVTGEPAKAPAQSTANTRSLRLVIHERPAAWPALGFDLQEPDAPARKTTAPPSLMAPLIVLTRGEPAEIEVVNNLKDATAIHWHGMELENLYDGVPGLTGDSRQATPAIQPGESFLVRMTPPRAGTFIYHTHWHDEHQLINGMYGPLIVLEPGQKYDADHDKIFLFSSGQFPDPLGVGLLLNGTPQPLRARLRTGEKYRFRMINVTANMSDFRVSLFHAGQPVRWRNLARDGADLPPLLAVAGPAQQLVTVGGTQDFEYQTDGPAELQLEGLNPGSSRRVVLTLVFEAEESNPTVATLTSPAGIKAGETFRDCPDCPEMVVVPAGTFTMGSPASEPGREEGEGPQRRVSINEFAAGKFDVTRGQWAAFVSATNRGTRKGCAWTGRAGIEPAWAMDPEGSWRNVAFPQDDSHPVVCITWDDAQDYVRWLSQRTGQKYRLLTEAEWKYAARAGTTTAFPWGPKASHDDANYGNETCCSGLASGRDRWAKTSPVGSFPRNGFGLYDMNGNVLQWVQDCFAISYAGLPTDGSAYETVVELKVTGRFSRMTGTSSCSYRMVRGGDWGDPPALIRSAAKNFGPGFGTTLQEYGSGGVGFRVAKTLN